jgi:hypothetical protein
MKRLLFLLLGVYCTVSAQAQEAAITGPKLVVYKTKGNYRNLVPVGLSEDRSRIISYPAPTDVKVADGYMKPSKLTKGYLLDNQGIGKNVAFLGITYEEYAKMAQSPSREELYTKIVDKDPLLELYDCGERKGKLSTLAKSLKKSIRKNKLSNCNKIR